MTKDEKLKNLTKKLVYQMTGIFDDDMQEPNNQIAFFYLNEAMNYMRSSTECCDICKEESKKGNKLNKICTNCVNEHYS